ncbi:MAG: hypothetical protein V1774_10090 [Candidatus Eisenbacteria bacterium]
MIAALQGVVFYPVQGDTAVNSAIVEQYGVWAYPTFVTLNQHGDPIQRSLGYGDAAGWSAWLSGVKADPISLAERMQRFEREPGFRDAVALGQTALSENHAVEAEGYFQRAMELDPQAAAKEGIPVDLVSAAIQGLGTGDITFDHVRQVTFDLLQSERTDPTQVLKICNYILRNQENFDGETLSQILRMAQPRIAPLEATAAEDEGIRNRLQTFRIEYALHVENDPERALELKRPTLPAGWESDPEELNGFAWWCFEREINLEEAERLGRQAVELVPAGPLQANILDTVAQIVYLRGDAEEAAALIRRALELDPESEYLQQQLEKFSSPDTDPASGPLPGTSNAS